tara:strand:+ start:39 stop:410 length:372 start_codon:yes stop_codon:yes gene_type:complete
MGYRSEVAIAIHKDVHGEFLAFLKTEELMREIFTSGWFELEKDFQGKGHWLFTQDRIKWYDGFPDEYPEVDMFERFFNQMDDDDDTESKYRFVRIGESNDDIEERGEWYDSDIYVKREIAIGW